MTVAVIEPFDKLNHRKLNFLDIPLFFVFRAWIFMTLK